MAFITKQEVQEKTTKLKKINARYNVKATFSGSNSHCLTLKIKSGAVDFIGNHIQVLDSNSNYWDMSQQEIQDRKAYLTQKGYMQVNHYHMHKHFSGTSLDYLNEVLALMKEGHYDESDIMTDYFNCAWYNEIHIGNWNAPYTTTK